MHVLGSIIYEIFELGPYKKVKFFSSSIFFYFSLYVELTANLTYLSFYKISTWHISMVTSIATSLILFPLFYDLDLPHPSSLSPPIAPSPSSPFSHGFPLPSPTLLHHNCRGLVVCITLGSNDLTLAMGSFPQLRTARVYIIVFGLTSSQRGCQIFYNFENRLFGSLHYAGV